MGASEWIVALNTAGLAVVAYLLLTRMETRLSAVERSTNRLVRVWALYLISSAEVSLAIKEEARDVLREMMGGRPSGAQDQVEECRGQR